MVVQRAQHFIGNTITKFVQERVQERVKHVVRKKDLSVKKFGKRKWEEIEDDDREKLKMVNEKVLQLNKEVEMMELQIECFKEMEEKYHSNNAKLEKLYNDNIIDSDGEIKT